MFFTPELFNAKTISLCVETRTLWRARAKRYGEKMAQNICGIIIGEARSTEEAEKLAETMKNCPYLLASGTTSNKIYFVSIVPEERKWWLKYPMTNPKATGVEKALVHIVENVGYPK